MAVRERLCQGRAPSTGVLNPHSDFRQSLLDIYSSLQPMFACPLKDMVWTLFGSNFMVDFCKNVWIILIFTLLFKRPTTQVIKLSLSHFLFSLISMTCHWSTWQGYFNRICKSLFPSLLPTSVCLRWGASACLSLIWSQCPFFFLKGQGPWKWQCYISVHGQMALILGGCFSSWANTTDIGRMFQFMGKLNWYCEDVSVQRGEWNTLSRSAPDHLDPCFLSCAPGHVLSLSAPGFAMPLTHCLFPVSGLTHLWL